MVTTRNSRTARISRHLMITSAILALVAGLSSTGYAQNERSVSQFKEASVDGSQAHFGAPIEGTWILTIDRVTQGFSFSALQAFTAGGVTVATGSVDRTPPPQISPLYGSWRRSGHDSYSVAICFFAFDTAGKAIAMIKTLETFQMVDKDDVRGSGTAFACDIHGNDCVDANLPITITGKRLIPDQAPDSI